MELYRQEKSKFWTADFVADGRRIRRSTRKQTKAAALEVAMEFYRKAQRSQLPERRQTAPSLADFAESEFLPFIRAREPLHKSATRVIFE